MATKKKVEPPIITSSPDLVRVPMTATIPTGQYANIQPQIEGIGKTFEEAQADAIKKIESMYSAVNSPVKFETSMAAAEQAPNKNVHYEYSVLDNNVKVAFDENSHTYEKGWLSGSAFAHMYAEDFDSESHANRMAKGDTDANTILDMWKLNAEVSTSFGTSLHNGLELRGKYAKASKDIKGTLEACLNKNPIIRELVVEFYDNFGDDDSFYEPFVANEEYKICGFIDKLKVIDREKKIVRVQDYKTNANILKDKKALPPFKGVVSDDALGNYWLQLSFYAFILEEAGYIVEGLDIYWPDLREFLDRDDEYVTCWKHFESDVIPIKEEIKRIR